MTTTLGERPDPTLVEWIRIMRDGWRVMVVLVLAGGLVGVLATRAQPSRYRTTGSVLVTPSTFLDPNSAPYLPILATTVEQLAGTAAVLKPAANRFVELAGSPPERSARRELATPSWLESHVHVAQTPNSSIIDISTIAPTQSMANDLTVALVRTLTRVINDQSRPRQGAGSSAGTGGVRVKIFTLAEPRGRLTPTPLKNVVLGLNAGFILGLLGALASGLAKRRLHRPDEIGTALGVLNGAIFTVAAATSEDSGLMGVSAYLQDTGRSHDERAADIVLITGTVDSKRLASVGVSLARALDASHAQPVLVAADFREHAASPTLGVDDRPGLTQAITTGARAKRSTNDDSLTRSTRRLASLFHRMAALGEGNVGAGLRLVAGKYDIALVVGPPVVDTAALLPLLRAANRVIFVTKRGVPARSLESARLVTRKLTAVLVLR